MRPLNVLASLLRHLMSIRGCNLRACNNVQFPFQCYVPTYTMSLMLALNNYCSLSTSFVQPCRCSPYTVVIPCLQFPSCSLQRTSFTFVAVQPHWCRFNSHHVEFTHTAVQLAALQSCKAQRRCHRTLLVIAAYQLCLRCTPYNLMLQG